MGRYPSFFKGLILRKSKAAKKKQKRKVKKKQVKALRFKKAARENGWFYLEDAHYSFDIGNMGRAVRFVKKQHGLCPMKKKFSGLIGEIDMILGRIRGEREFSEIVYDIWVNSKTEQDRKKSFTNLGTRLKRAKTGYNKTRELDEKLFGDTYEL